MADTRDLKSLAKFLAYGFESRLRHFVLPCLSLWRDAIKYEAGCRAMMRSLADGEQVVELEFRRTCVKMHRSSGARSRVRTILSWISAC